MSNSQIKICDVRTPEIAQFCAENGIDFIGLHQIFAPVSEETINNFKKIKLVSGNTKVVLVTKIDNMDELVKISCALPWDYVQLHFHTTTDFIAEFKDRVYKTVHRNIGIIAVFPSNYSDFSYIHNIAKEANYLLFDSSMIGGTGKLSSVESLQRIKDNFSNYNYFVAGGLTPENVSSVLKTIQPFALDVQSGVEKEKHVKDKDKILSFINAVKSN